MTASPGYSRRQVEDLCQRLGIERIHLRSSTDTRLKRYLSDLDSIEIRVEVPEELRELARPLIVWQEGLIDVERRLGEVRTRGGDYVPWLGQRDGQGQGSHIEGGQDCVRFNLQDRPSIDT